METSLRTSITQLETQRKALETELEGVKSKLRYAL